MIAARAQELIALIDRRAVLRAHVDQLDAFQGREQKLTALLETFRPLVEAAETLRRRGVAVIRVDERLPGVLSQLHRVQAVYREERDAFVDSRRSGFADFERTLSPLFTHLEMQVRESWRTHTKQQAQPLDPEVLRVLGSIPDYVASVRRLRVLDQTVTELRESLPVEDVCQRFEEVAEERRAIWEEMRGGDFSPEILRFLHAASSGGAVLDSLTPTVLQWLRNHRLVNSFRITMATRAGA